MEVIRPDVREGREITRGDAAVRESGTDQGTGTDEGPTAIVEGEGRDLPATR